ncbi:hypothetical protein BJF81_03345 [Ornithinimicrobium sp. CNJ-824]|nr:HAMP domain-containing sensor histidine kinase [Ornithinimicrobium sp. CNJ-824]OLT20919.1 hypothetical protein BJF81_03345 [Ornithinimicrobium sp. CNJ-824]
MPAEQGRTGPAPVAPGTADRAPGPLGGVGTVRTKIGLLVAGSVLAAVVVLEAGRGAGVPGWLTLPVTLAVALVVTQWLARGMTAPLRAMTEAADRMAAGDYSTVVTATGHDEVTRLADAFTRMAGDLDRADTTRRQLLETVSHELRTPLAAQRALLENLVDGVVQPDDAALQGALAQAERLSDLVTDLLDLTRLESGAVPLVLTPTSAADLLTQAVAEAGLGARDVQHRTVVTPTDLEVLVDPARMSQVVGNLLDNASRHSPTGGTVTLHVRGPGETGTSPDGSEDPVPMDRWRLEVVDEGPGIPPDRAEAVFTRYGRGDDRGGGTGLGLAIARWICELHGGSVSAHPRPDGRPGACLRVELPVRPPSGRPAGSREDGSTERPSTGAATPGPVAVPVAQGPAAHAVDPLFGRLWPPERMPAAPVQLVGAVGIGAFAALVLPDHDAGLGLLTVLLAGGAWCSGPRCAGARPGPSSARCSAWGWAPSSSYGRPSGCPCSCSSSWACSSPRPSRVPVGWVRCSWGPRPGCSRRCADCPCCSGPWRPPAATGCCGRSCARSCCRRWPSWSSAGCSPRATPSSGPGWTGCCPTSTWSWPTPWCCAPSCGSSSPVWCSPGPTWRSTRPRWSGPPPPRHGR